MAEAVVGFDPRIRAKYVEGVVAPPLSPPLYTESDLKKVPPGLSSPISSIGPALSEPNIMYSLLAVYNETERLNAKSAHVFEAETSRTMAEIEKITAEKQEALQKEAEATKTRATWGTLSTVAQYITGTGTVVLGTSIFVMPGGQIPGAALIASGVIGLGTRTLQDTGLLEQQITHKIERLAFFLQMGLGLAGGIGAWRTGALAAAQINGSLTQKTIGSFFTGANTALTITGQVGTTYYDKKMADLQARRKELDGQNFLHEQTLQSDTMQMVKMIENTQLQADELRKAIEARQVSID